MKYRDYNFLPRILKLKFINRDIEFLEPTIWQTMFFQEYIKNGEYMKAFDVIGLNITEKEFKQKPSQILEGVISLISNKDVQNAKVVNVDTDEENVFLPSTYDILGKRYGKTPIEIMQTMTYSQLEGIFAGIEYNSNVEMNKKGKNVKFFAKIDTSAYKDTLERVREARKKMDEKKYSLD